MEPFDAFLEALGGRAAVAEITGAKPNAITQWRQAGVPFKYWHRIIRAAHVRGLRVDEELLERTRPKIAA